jgi:hypothetical protein
MKNMYSGILLDGFNQPGFSGWKRLRKGHNFTMTSAGLHPILSRSIRPRAIVCKRSMPLESSIRQDSTGTPSRPWVYHKSIFQDWLLRHSATAVYSNFTLGLSQNLGTCKCLYFRAHITPRQPCSINRHYSLVRCRCFELVWDYASNSILL